MRLKELRIKNNLSQVEVAKIANCSQSNYSKYEKEKIYPDVLTITKLADYYNVSIDYLVDRKWDNKSYIEIWKLSEKQKESFSLIEKLNDIECLQVQTYIKSMQETLNNPDMETLRILKTKD